ncbi:MAG: DUF4157 domain-containing protein, partial [Methyloprofundus sp.]|nr:DUF4157 domain-containing protein [Methyloprofundus sp.]
EEEVQAKLQRKPTERLQAKGTPDLSNDAEQKIQQMRGQGNSLPKVVRQEMEGKVGADFSAVRIHDDSTANDINKQINARAFTLGNDIYFGSGEYSPATMRGKRLLAHELTHVVQQSSVVQKKIQRTYKSAEECIEFSSLQYPSVAKVDSGHYANYLPLIRHKNYSGNRQTSQSEKFRTYINSHLTGSTEKLANAIGYSAPAAGDSLIFKVPSPNVPLSGPTGGDNVRYAMGSSLNDIASALVRPTWTRDGRNAPLERRRVSFEVDHIVEAQVGASSTGGDYAMKAKVDKVGNYILLRGDKNQKKGDTVKANVLAAINDFTAGNSDQYGGKAFSEWSASALKNSLSMKFLNVNSSGGQITDNDVWTINEIERGDHIGALLNANPVQIRCVSLSSIEQTVAQGDLLVFHSEQGGLRRLLNQQSSMNGKIRMSGARNMLKPFRLHDDSIIHNVQSATPGMTLATLYFSIPEDSATKLPALEKSEPVEIKSLNGSTKLGYFETGRFLTLMGLRREVRGLSPIEVDGVDLTERGLSVTGRINPSVPALEDASIDFEILGDSLTVSKMFTIGEISVPPPFNIDQASVTISGGTGGFEL